MGNLVITGAGGFGNSPRIIATDEETGKVIWESSFSDTPDVTFTATPLAIKDRIIVGAANGDQGVRDWIAGLDAATGKRYLPCAQSDFMSTLGSSYFSACRNRDFHFKNRTGSSTVYLPRKRLSKSGVHGHAS